MGIRRLGFWSFSLTLLSLPTSATEKVGNVGAANTFAYGTPPGHARQTLSVGLSVEKGERVDTSQDGSAQIVFNDTSTMTVGRNSSVVIDDFVHHGNETGFVQSGRFIKGAMRFVGGAVSHTTGATFKTPTAQIGVRGGSFVSRIGGECGTFVMHQAGRIEVTSLNGEAQTLSRPGFGVCATKDGVSAAFRVNGKIIAEITSELASHNGQHGGATSIPDSEDVNHAFGNMAPPSVDSPPGLEALGPVWAGNSIVQSGANVNNQPAPPVASSRAPDPPPPPPPPPPPDTSPPNILD